MPRTTIPTPLVPEAVPFGVGSEARSWLEESWEDPEPLRRALQAEAERAGALPLRSRPGESYDFYQDLVARHAVTASPALGWFEGGAPRELGYRELHARSTRLAEAWLAAGVIPGKTPVCIVLPMGADLVVALVTALRLALPLSLLPPAPAPWLALRIGQLPDDPRIVTAPEHEGLLDGFRDRLLAPAQAPRRGPPSSILVPAKTVVARVFSPRHDPPDQPVELTAEVAWSGESMLGPVALVPTPGVHVELRLRPDIGADASARGADRRLQEQIVPLLGRLPLRLVVSVVTETRKDPTRSTRLWRPSTSRRTTARSRPSSSRTKARRARRTGWGSC